MKLFPWLCCELAPPRAYMVIFDHLNFSARVMRSLSHIWQLFALIQSLLDQLERIKAN